MAEYIFKLVENEEELRGVNEVRRQVFVNEQRIAEGLVFEKSKDVDEINVAVKDEDLIIGTARVVFPVENTAKIERMAVLEHYRGKGLGKGIISFLNEEFKRRKIAHIVLHAQYQVIDFYRACGFRESGLPFEEAGIRHVKMDIHY